MHTHPHSHAPDPQGHGHSHAHGAGASERRIGLAALLTGAFMLAEVAGGLISGSLALIADAGHMLTDCAGLVLAWLGFRIARRPADGKRSYGYDRFGVLVAFANGLALFAIAIWIVIEAVHRLNAPSPVLGGIMFWVALAGLLVNVLAFWLVQGGDHGNLNVRAAALHVVGDLLGSVAALAAAVVILTTGWTPIDPILSVAVALLILRHVRGWGHGPARPPVPLRARSAAGGDPPEAIAAAIKARLKTAYGVDHATVELEFERCADAAPSKDCHPAPR